MKESLSDKKLSQDEIKAVMSESGMWQVSPEDDAYPALLRQIAGPPEVLYVRGELPSGKCVAIVGSRRDTRYGRQQAFAIAKELAQNGVTVVSGMARGIDTAAHEGALAGGGKTVAVLGCGADVCYPPENKVLMENILYSGGAVISEYPPGTQPLPYHFPLRNRIISGLSDALLLIEARLKSGTNSTVNYALDQGRDVFTLPGNVDSPGSELPLKLLKEGAAMCTCADDILFGMGWKEQDAEPEETGEQLSFVNSDDPVLRALALEEKTFEELAEETGMPPGDLSAALTMLEMEDTVEKRAGRAYAIKKK